MANEYKTSTAVGERESLDDVIYRIDPDETPVYSNVAKETSRAVFEEWQVQELASAADDNYVNEAADASFATPTATTRLGNYHGISVKSVAVSGTLDVVDKAGRDRELQYQKVLKGLELRRDIEKSLFADQARSGSDPRKPGVLKSWITNYSINGGSAPTGDGTDYYGQTTAGSGRALALSQIESAMQAAYEDGGQPNMLVFSPTNKANFSDLAESNSGIVANQLNMTQAKDGTLVGSVSVYLTDFGTLDVVVDRFLGNSAAYLLDTDYVSIMTLPGRNFFVKPIAATGDAEKFEVITEWTLKPTAPRAHAAVYDLNGS